MSSRGNYHGGGDSILGSQEPQVVRDEDYDNVKSPNSEERFVNRDEDTSEERFVNRAEDTPQQVSGSGYEINIKTLNSGYLVNVGCQQIAVERTETLIKALGEYLENPSEFQQKWFNNPNRSKLS